VAIDNIGAARVATQHLISLGHRKIAHISGPLSMVNIGIITSLIFPSDSLFRKVMFLLLDSADDPISFAASLGIYGTTSIPSDLMIIYAVVYGACALLLAVRHFARRDL
jgi:hypothetical protein